ncbi:hypothetical protein OVA26_16770 [Microbacterium sp. SL62]|uniref:hypothetical protein n=1 Tax=Microbacterium sp. SL62 TaxID=2995139 RepID=UPI002273E3DF|nr:hypothetical protein [Microbacterium sp. SL62]MCY1718592.1 hypothetical protein [Microbacterium sp. SL62]
MTPRDSLTVTPGLRLEIPGHWGGYLLLIDSYSHVEFQLLFSADGAQMDVEVAAQSPMIEASIGDGPGIDRLELHVHDVVTIPGIGSKVLSGIIEIRPGRFQLHLDEKFAERIVVDVLTVDTRQLASAASR